MPTFPRGFLAAQAHAQNARLLEQLARETSSNVAEERRRLLLAATPADSRTLRGLPAIGRTVQGVIFGTQPEQALVAKETRRR